MSEQPASKLKCVLWRIIWCVLVSPVIALLFSLLAMIGWGLVHNEGHAEHTMSVAGTYYWIMINPFVGYAVGIGFGLTILYCAKKKPEKILLWPMAFLCGSLPLYLAILGLCEFGDNYHRSTWKERAEAGIRRSDPESFFVLGINASDPKQAREYLFRAAETGHPLAMLHLGEFYRDREFRGEANPEYDITQAILWLKRTADSGDLNAPNAQAHLGDIYADESSGACDYKQALFWYSKCAGRFDSAAYSAGILHLEGKLGAPDYPAAAAFFVQSVNNGGFEGYYQLGRMHELGFGFPQNMAKAIACYRQGYLISDSCRQALERLNVAVY